jgi:hypothetical protein
MSENNQSASLFEQATRQKLRFPSNRGELTVEDLWTMPLQSKSGFDVDTVAKTVNSKIKELSEDSFVSTKPSKALAQQQLMLDVIKHVIAVRLAEAAAKEKRVAQKAERARLEALLESRQQAEEANLTQEQILAKLAALGQDEGDE